MSDNFSLHYLLHTKIESIFSEAFEWFSIIHLNLPTGQISVIFQFACWGASQLSSPGQPDLAQILAQLPGAR